MGNFYSMPIPNHFQYWQPKAPTFDTAPPTIAELGKITDRTFLISLCEIKNCRFINSQSEFIKMYDGIKLFIK